jgi:DNA helicase-2/ATP-dependent DNA helicase PcrA
VVGDDDQSIYKFRGASVSNILKFKEDYPNLKQITLIQNYRSTQNILDLAYKFIQANNPDRLEIRLNINKQLKSILPQQGFIEVLEGNDLSNELDLVAKKILELKNNPSLNPSPRGTPNFAEQNLGNPRPHKGGEGRPWNDFAILIRANSAANELLPVLSAHGIPFTFVANRGLYKKPIIVDILSYLKILNNFHDSQSLYRVLTLPNFYINHQELSFLLHYAQKKTISLFESLEQAQLMTEISKESKNEIIELLNFLKKHSQETKNRTAAEMLVQILKDLEIEKKLQADTLENAENRELLEQFYKKIESFEQQNSDKSLHNFLLNLELEMQAGSDGIIKFDPNIGPESLKVMTIHSAKGLEFECVFIINLVEQRFPTRERREPVEIPEKLIKDILPEGDFHLQEERRLFYVSITRAKTHLFLSWAKDYGGLRIKRPSQFLIETNFVPSEKTSQATGRVIFTKPTKLQVVYQNLPNQFSYSQLVDFQNCPLKYKYQHYLKLPVPGTGNLSFGQTIHKALEEFLKLYKTKLEMSQLELFNKTDSKDSKLPDFEILEKLYQKFWIDDWYESKAEKDRYRKEGQNILKIFFEFQKLHNPKPKYIEEYFKLPLGKYSFVGKIDRGDEKEKGLEIIDYKTGKVPKSKNDIDQLYVYQWAAQEYLNEKVISLKYWYLQENNFFEESPANSKQIAALKQKLLEIMSRIIHTTKYNLFKQEHTSLKDHKCEFETLE